MGSTGSAIAGAVNPLNVIPALVLGQTMKAPRPPALTPPPSLVDETAAATIQGIRTRRARRGAATNPSQLTGPLGLTMPPDTASKTLLGL